MKDYYAILGLPRNCKHDDIKKAYRTLAKEHHPDKSKNENCFEFRDVQEAYETLSKDKTRQDYDNLLRQNEVKHKTGSSRFARSRHHHVFDEFPFFQFVNNANTQFFEFPINDFGNSRYNLELILSSFEARQGGEVPVDIPILDTCEVCFGTGTNGFWPCEYCNGAGVRNQDYRISLKYPPNLQHNDHLIAYIDGFGDINITVKIYER